MGSSDGNHSIGSSPDGAAPTDMRISVRRSCLGSLANIITLWHRPSHKDTREEEQKCLLFYQRETILSSITSIFMAVVNLGIKASQPKPIGWSDWTALGFVLVCLLTSQLYTQLCHCSLLFNLNPETTENITLTSMPTTEDTDVNPTGDPVDSTHQITDPATRTNVQSEDASGSEDVKTKSNKSSGKCSLSCCLGLCNFDCTIKCTWDWKVIIPNLIFFTCLITFWVALGFQLAHIKGISTNGEPVE